MYSNHIERNGYCRADIPWYPGIGRSDRIDNIRCRSTPGAHQLEWFPFS